MNNYEELLFKIKSLCSQTENKVSILANVSAVLFEMGDVSWAGFYMLENEKLLLGPFQGRVACTEIEIGKGVCGTSFEKRETLIVADVHKFDGHIACDSRSNSEIVVPITKNDLPIGVIDIDSTSFDRFSKIEKDFLEKVSYIVSKKM
ncbi:GAF domain-containing protein [Peptoniphilus indolicus]|uniref:GAF domain protein n=2 Tax=Peptoniphilus indolicus TaxID=33030 RepID=G4D1G1_9FIRM|nr:GAF domain-containing protein [Peptoniphilus indolicus]EGY80610.1 GAF domain protein [Peptoniphilus indolicus ATCC 29427]SUB74937.1 Free methionine-R-sulfoxide reductase [Peptoniphilus indolicus]